MKRLAIVALVAVIAVQSGQTVPALQESFDAKPISRFSKSDRSVLAELLIGGQNVVVLNIASKTGSNGSVADGLTRLGATVRFREDRVDYLSAIVPLDRATDASWLPGIESVAVDMGLFRSLDAAGAEAVAPAAAEIRRPKFPPPGPDTPKENPYLPTRDIGAPQFIAAHPTFDGRGVAIAFIDGGIELLIPEMQTATTLDGRPTRKIIDWINPVGPLDEQLPSIYAGPMLAALGYPWSDSTWVDMRETVVAVGAAFVHNAISYAVPAPGTYRIGFFDERREGSAIAAPFRSPGNLLGDVNRDGNPPGSSGIFAVLWDERTNNVWVDTNQDNSFADERAMTDYAVRFDVGTFGVDDPSTAVRETVPFVIQTDRRAKFVSLGVTSGSHGTLVAGTAIGRGFFGGAFDGVAPGAQGIAVLLDGNVHEHNIIESLIRAGRHPAADVITLTTGRRNRLDDESQVLDVVVNRLIEHSGKAVVVSAGNSGPGMSSSGHPAVATNAIGAGAYTSRDTWLANFGARVADSESLRTFSSRGPRGDGALKPDVLAPTGGISLLSATAEEKNEAAAYQVPLGYLMGGGTSQAAPFAAGALALLLSGARQTGLPADPARLKLALVNGARFLTGYGAHEQGSGLVQIGASWAALQKLRDLPPRIRIDAPVRTVESANFATPHRGVGLLEREGWAPGQRDTRVVTLTRTSGSDRPWLVGLRLIGNDGTFGVPPEVTLPLHVPVDVPVTVAPSTAGAHSALLQIVDRDRSLVIHSTALTIVAAEEFSASGQFTISRSAQAPRPGSVSHFVRVPERTPMLSVAVRVLSGSLQVVLHDPTGMIVDSTYGKTWPGYEPTGKEVRRDVESPRPGVWEVTIDNSPETTRIDRSFPDPLPPADYTFTARILGAELSRAEPTVDVFEAISSLAPFKGSMTGTSIGTEQTERVALTRARPQTVRDIEVPAGTERLIVEVGAASRAGADLDVYLFDCTGKRCALRAHGITSGASERVSVDAPAAGAWKVVVDASAMSTETVQADYREVLLHPIYGHVDVDDTPRDRAVGAKWQARVVPHVDARPQQPGRRLIGFVEVVDAPQSRESASKGEVTPTAALGRTMIDVDAIARSRRSPRQAPLSSRLHLWRRR